MEASYCPPARPCWWQVILGEVIGQGSFGTTYRGTWRGGLAAGGRAGAVKACVAGGGGGHFWTLGRN